MNRSISFVTTLVAITALSLAPASARAQRDRDRMRVDSTFAFEKGSWVDVGAAAGEIVVTGWTRPEAKVYASIDRGWIDAQLSSHRITIQTRSDRGRSGPVRVEIMVPIGTRVQVTSASGSIRVMGTDGEVDASSVSGAIEVLGATDRISVHTVSGKVHAAKLRGRTRLGTTNATIEAEDVIGDITAGTVSGRITMTDVKSSHVSAETVNSSINYAGSIDPAGSYEFSSHSGSIHLEILENAAADLALETFSGHINIGSGFPITLQPGDITAMARLRKKMDFTIGKGGAHITASTFSGNITIDRSGHTDREEN